MHITAKIWGTDDFGGFGFLNFVFEGLVSGDKYGSAVGIAALTCCWEVLLVLLCVPERSTQVLCVYQLKNKGLERLALPLLFFAFSFGGATFGMAEEVIPFLNGDGSICHCVRI